VNHFVNLHPISHYVRTYLTAITDGHKFMQCADFIFFNSIFANIRLWYMSVRVWTINQLL